MIPNMQDFLKKKLEWDPTLYPSLSACHSCLFLWTWPALENGHSFPVVPTARVIPTLQASLGEHLQSSIAPNIQQVTSRTSPLHDTTLQFRPAANRRKKKKTFFFCCIELTDLWGPLTTQRPQAARLFHWFHYVSLNLKLFLDLNDLRNPKERLQIVQEIDRPILRLVAGVSNWSQSKSKSLVPWMCWRYCLKQPNHMRCVRA